MNDTGAFKLRKHRMRFGTMVIAGGAVAIALGWLATASMHTTAIKAETADTRIVHVEPSGHGRYDTGSIGDQAFPRHRARPRLLCRCWRRQQRILRRASGSVNETGRKPRRGLRLHAKTKTPAPARESGTALQRPRPPTTRSSRLPPRPRAARWRYRRLAAWL